MKISDQQFKRMPAHLQVLFRKLPNPGSEEVLAAFPESSTTGKRSERSKSATVAGTSWGTDNHQSTEYTDSGSAARFFYCAKASKADRDEGLEWFEAKPANTAYGDGLNTATKIRTADQSEIGVSRELRRNNHPTVKPTDLMRYLCRLVTPPGGVVLDPFTGSGSTGKAAMLEGFQFIGCELSEEYIAIARARIEAACAQDDKQRDLFV